jgi:hypothetical protein
MKDTFIRNWNIDRNFALYFGLSGLLARSTFIYLDARLNDYEFYSCLDYNVFLALNGDCLDRYFLRFNEMVESCRIIYSLLLFLFSSSFLFSLWSLSEPLAPDHNSRQLCWRLGAKGSAQADQRP